MNDSAPELSVIICAHNPRPDFLKRTLAGLQAQNLPADRWELLLVDNASEPPLDTPLGWHPDARICREPGLGLVRARICGIHQSRGEILVFVDDDNVLAPDYLEIVLRLAKDWPFIGAWGGQCHAEFEVTPAEWTRPFWKYITIREFDEARWANIPHWNDSMPFGSGLCVRRMVAEAFLSHVHSNPHSLNLGRRGDLLYGSEDFDLALSACDVGLGTGIFPELHLHHLIAARRLSPRYLKRLVQSLECSFTLFEAARGHRRPRASWLDGIILALKSPRLARSSRWIYWAQWRGRRAAQAALQARDAAPRSPVPQV
jgi:glycosyltransferase involved in cell wall biosynthesis